MLAGPRRHTVHAPVKASYRPTTNTALLLSPDALGAALVGAAIELAGIGVIFVGTEQPLAILRRARPSYLLIDCADPAAADEALIGPAMMMGTRVVLFGDERSAQLLRPTAVRLRLGFVVLPRDVDDLIALLSGTKTSREEIEG